MKFSRLARFIIGIVTALALSIALVMAVMRPPWADMWQLALSFLISGGASAIFGFIAHRMGWWRRVSRISYTITLGYVLAAGLTLLNVWLTASLMFINEHDLTLAGLLLLFSSGVSISFGYFLSSSITQTLSDIVQAARKVGEGDFSARVIVTGKDETAQLAQAFNAMTERLAQAETDSRALDAARRDLVAWASHDLRTPLTSIRAMLDALTDGVVSDPETVARYLQQSRSEVSRMSLIINDLFELSQLDTGHIVLKLEQASVADIISDTLQGFSLPAQNKGIDLTGSVAPRLSMACIAPEKISRVLQNLVENALRHTPAGGSVTLRAEQTDNTITVSVRDTGEGIPAADLPRVFERFYRGERSRAREVPGSQPGQLNAGAGLGLAIAKGLVEAHQGRIWAESEPGKGTVVFFSLPVGG